MIKNIFEFKSETLNFELKIDSFDCVDYHTCLDMCETLKPGETVGKECLKEFTSLPNLSVSFENQNKQKMFVPLSNEVLNLFFSKNIHSTSFIFNAVFEYIISTYNEYQVPDEVEGEKKSHIQ